MKGYFYQLSLTCLASMLSVSSFAQTDMRSCPILTAQDVRNTIDNGAISTYQSATLASEVNLTPAQVITAEPTANPFDTYYYMYGSKKSMHHLYMIIVSSVLGKDVHEAKHRAKKILLHDEKVFYGKYDESSSFCIYKQINASPTYAHYPYKTQYETVTLALVRGTSQLNGLGLLK